jgi:hypothetical protein
MSTSSVLAGEVPDFAFSSAFLGEMLDMITSSALLGEEEVGIFLES